MKIRSRIILFLIIGIIGTMSVFYAYQISHYSLEIQGMKDTYFIEEEYSFYYTLSGYGHTCGTWLVWYPDQKGSVIPKGEVIDCSRPTNKEFSFNSEKFTSIMPDTAGIYNVTVSVSKIKEPTIFEFTVISTKSYSIEKLLMDNNIGATKELFVQRTTSTSGDPACGIAVDNSDKLHWFGIDSFSNPNKMTVFQENPQLCKVNTSSCFCDVYTKLISLTTELIYFTPEEEQKYSDILIDYLAEENINRTPKFLIGKLNVNYTDSSAIGYCGEIWGANTYGFFDGAIVNDVVMDYGIAKELPLLCAISDDSMWWERK